MSPLHLKLWTRTRVSYHFQYAAHQHGAGSMRICIWEVRIICCPVIYVLCVTAGGKCSGHRSTCPPPVSEDPFFELLFVCLRTCCGFAWAFCVKKQLNFATWNEFFSENYYCRCSSLWKRNSMRIYKVQRQIKLT